MKWNFLLFAVLFDVAAAMGPFDYYQWPPPHPLPTIGAAWLLPGAGAVLSLFSLACFIRVRGRRRLLALLPASSLAFAAFCVWYYPRAYDRFIHEHAARIRALGEQMAREHQQQENQ